MHIPATLWEEPAVLVREMSRGERRVAGEGSLFAMVTRIASLPDNEWHRYAINLPDRRAAPFTYTWKDFGSLLSARARGRAGIFGIKDRRQRG